MSRSDQPYSIRIAESAEDVQRCYPIMHELRSHIDSRGFLEQVRRQRETDGYQLAYLEDQGEIIAVAGFRVVELLAWGVALYVDDLVTKASSRSSGHGGRLFDWLVTHARSRGCGQLHLDSGVQRFGAHRFYLNKGMDITSHHFAMKL